MIEQSRVKKACGRDAFLSRVYTGEEQRLIQKDIRKAASNWAVKEAVVKVLGTGFSGGIEPVEIEVLREPSGKPYVRLYGRAKEQAGKLGIERIYVALSHAGDMVSAVAVGEGEPTGGQDKWDGQGAKM